MLHYGVQAVEEVLGDAASVLVHQRVRAAHLVRECLHGVGWQVARVSQGRVCLCARVTGGCRWSGAEAVVMSVNNRGHNGLAGAHRANIIVCKKIKTVLLQKYIFVTHVPPSRSPKLTQGRDLLHHISRNVDQL